jgi:putative inorganic carbon (hco3(-)) transporter
MSLSASQHLFDAEPFDAARPAAPRSTGTAFCLFLVLNAVLFVRPTELMGATEVFPVYQIVMACCALAALPVLSRQLAPAAIAARPASFCVIGLIPAIVLSNLKRGDLYTARVGGAEFAKVAGYFLLLVGLLDSPRRLGTFLRATAAFIFVVATLALLQYHGLLDVESLRPLEQYAGVDELGELEVFRRLQGTGIFSDPNDFSLALVTAMLIVAHLAFEQRRWVGRIAYAGVAAWLASAFAGTQSRGGFLAMVAGSAAYLFSRWGWGRSLPLALVLLPVLVIALAGRQTHINLDDPQDTAQGRIQLWREGLAMIRACPILGVGYGQFEEGAGQVAHNSYVHCYAELGIPGGTLFVGTLFLPLISLRDVARVRTREVSDDLARWRPCVLAVLVAYMLGLCSLTRSYAMPTYLVAGVASAYCNLAAAAAPSAEMPRGFRLLGRLAWVSIGVLFTIALFVRLAAR